MTTLWIFPASAEAMKSLNRTCCSFCCSLVDTFQIRTPTTTTTIQNNKLFKVEFKPSLPKA